jgi:hypothetical protein
MLLGSPLLNRKNARTEFVKALVATLPHAPHVCSRLPVHCPAGGATPEPAPPIGLMEKWIPSHLGGTGMMEMGMTEMGMMEMGRMEMGLLEKWIPS